MSGKWIKWEGGKMPVPKGTVVDVKFRSGETFEKVSAGIEWCSAPRYWVKDGYMSDIVAYRVVTPANRKRAKPPAPKRERRKAEPKKDKVSVPEHKGRDELVSAHDQFAKTEKVAPVRWVARKIGNYESDGYMLTEAGEQALNGFPWYIWTLAISGWLAFGVAVWVR